MALPVVQFPALTPAQANPLAAGIGQANNLYQQGISNEYMQPLLQQKLMAQTLANKISQAQANLAPQTSAAQLAYQQAKTPNLNATTQYILGGQLPTSQAQAGLLGTEAAKNQFYLNHPASLFSGLPGQIGTLSYLPDILNNYGKGVPAPSPVSYKVNQSGVPGIPSAGNISSSNNSPLLPPNPYSGASQNTQNTSASNSNSVPLPPQNRAANSQVVPGTGMTVSQLQNLAMQGALAPIQEKVSQANYYGSKANLTNQQSSAFAFNSLPQNVKTYMIGQAQGMGIPAPQAIKAFYNGDTISSMATKAGYDPNNLPSPIIAPTPAALTQMSVRRQARAELNVMEPFVTSALAPYSAQFRNYSPKQMWGAIQNDNPQQQMKALAAIQLSPEIVATRARSMGTQLGIETLREISQKSQMNLKAMQAFVTPKVFQGAQDLANHYINQGGNAANTVGMAGSLGNTGGVNPSVAYQPGAPVQTPQNAGNISVTSPAPQTTAASSMVRVIAPNGRTGSIPASNLAAAMKAGYRSAQ